ncbi:stemmadenine O-acetyltransferase-like [Mercurialis annua]|uniref:stemmadenine O-acetyltransferase-like n=1 Tax=Mercurialis annua TaxID=3986 RepID=UPI00215F8DFC|nr:stemmadenine O-acetyltransferase-like [Mercurialis annua]
MEVEIIYKDCIKPSSPTPPHLKMYNISLLDQFTAFVYVPMILYYSNPDNDLIPSKKTLILKRSLSQTLTQFYPLAGQITDDLSVECNDEGVLYLEARANISLSEFLQHPDITSLHQFLPNKSLLHSPTSGSYVAMIQETTFACGGFTLGINVLHLVMDGCALASFLRAWGAMAYDESQKKMIPSFHGPSIFPKDRNFPGDANMIAIFSNFIRVEKMKAARFVFDGSAIANLKEKVTNSGVKNPTRVEVVSALLSKSLMLAFESKSDNNNNPLPLAIVHAVNVRRRMLPPFPECSMGNFICLADTIISGSSKETQLSSFVCQLKEAIAEIDSSYVKSIQGDDGFIKFYEKIKKMNSAFTSTSICNGVDYVGFTSWCGFCLYEVDFGWGKPIWTSYAESYGNGEDAFANHVILMDARTGNNGIEAWVFSDEGTVIMLEKDQELLKYAYLNPTPLFN